MEHSVFYRFGGLRLLEKDGLVITTRPPVVNLKTSFLAGDTYSKLTRLCYEMIQILFFEKSKGTIFLAKTHANASENQHLTIFFSDLMKNDVHLQAVLTGFGP